MFIIPCDERPFLVRRVHLLSFTVVPVFAVTFGLVAGLVVLSGCSDAPRADASLALPAPFVADSPTRHTASIPDTIPAAEIAPPLTTPFANDVDLATLIAAAQRRHPTAQAIAAARQAAEARAVQAGLWANPDIEFSYGRTRPGIADVDVDKPYGVQLSQRMEWWGKRHARQTVASAQTATVEAESAAALLDVEIEVRGAAIAYTSAQRVAELSAAQVALAEELLDVVNKRQALGDIDHGESARIRLEATTARIRYDAAIRMVTLQRALLRIWCSDAVPDGIQIRDALVDPQREGDGIPETTADTHPRIRAVREVERAAEAQAQVERYARIPDMTVGVFGDREWEKDTFGVTLGFELLLWDRHVARIAEAEADRSRYAAQRRAVSLTLERERLIAVEDWKASAAEIIALRDQAIPVAEEAWRLRTTAFQSGDASLAEVLDARRALQAVQSDMLAARRRHAEAYVRWVAATGSRGQP